MEVTIKDLLLKATAEIDLLTPGDVFSLRDLFKGYEWKKISQGDRRTLGTLFLNFAQEDPRIEIRETRGQKEYVVMDDAK